MSGKADYRVKLFRDKFERDLRKIITQSVAVATCCNEGNAEVEETEMNVLSLLIIDLIERTKRKRVTKIVDNADQPTLPGVIVPIKKDLSVG